MKLTFTFSDSSESEALKNDGINSYFQLPDAALQLPDCRERVLALATHVGTLTQAVLHLSCRELGLKLHPIKLTHSEDVRVNGSFRDTLVRFQRRKRIKFEYAQIKVITPIKCPFTYALPSRRKGGGGVQNYLIQPQFLNRVQPDQQPYLDTINQLAELCLPLLNADVDTVSVGQEDNKLSLWTFAGFHPHWLDKAAVTKANKKISRYMAEQRRKAKHEARLLEQQSAQPAVLGTEVKLIPTTGAGRRIGAVPGVFKGVQFRSQLEIRFVTQLEEMGIRWVYESERLGDGSYLVDFYLPDLKIWVEVKGKFEPRDNFLLKDVAAYLKRERNERLYVFSASKAYAVNSRSFHEINHKLFWTKIGNR